MTAWPSALVLAAVPLWVAPACAQVFAPALGPPLAPAPAMPRVALDQRLGAELPLEATFTASDGRAVRLADEFAAPARPVLLVPGYLRCPQLCGLLMHGLLESLHAAKLGPSDVRIVFVSIDPADTPADAAERARVDLAYARFLDGDAAPPALDLLTGPAASIAALMDRTGAIYQSVATTSGTDFAHPAAIIVVTPGGRISRYLMGVRFDPDELRLALSEARGDRIGAFTDRVALMCAHIDLRAGVHTAGVMTGVRAVALASLLALALFVRLRGGPRRRPR